jgi:phosphatidylserine/phosphatidylglycerophosphate/cardiolipin synthase-like enzyme
VIAELNRARTSIDVAMFLFTSQTLSDALIAAKGRGVQVRVIMDNYNARHVNLSKNHELAAGGVQVKLHTTPAGIKFHHKFCVIDGATTLTGSYNWSESADESNYENYATIHDPAIARAYGTEFDSLWTSGTGGVGSSGDVVFSPSATKAIEARIVREIQAAQHEIVVAMYLMTSTDCTNAIVAALQRGVHVSMLFDAKQVHIYQANETAVKNAGASVKVVNLGGSGAYTVEFHDKFAVIDGQKVVTGSYNWDPRQDTQGFENIVVLSDANLARSYVQSFQQAWSSPYAH